MYEQIPQEIKDLRQWCCFKLVNRDGKKTKLPVDANTGKMAKSNDESTWSTYEQAVDSASRFDGIGFFFKSPYVGIDIDNVREDIECFYEGEREGNIIYEFTKKVDSYMEMSVSGNGIHIICKGKLPNGNCRHKNVEMYDKNRFFVMTGNKLGTSSDVNNVPDSAFEYLYDKYIGKQNKTKYEANTTSTDTNTNNDLSVEEIINKASKSRNGARFSILMNGGWEQFYESQSQADLALANDLAFWCAKDFNKMDTIFRQSSLYRQKYEEKRNRETYGVNLLNKAISECSSVYNESDTVDGFFINLVDGKTDVKQKSYSWDDTGNAERFRDVHNGVLRYSYEAKRWYFYNGKMWTQDFQGVTDRAVDSVLEFMKKENIYVADDVNPEEADEKFQKHIKRSRNAAGRKNMVEVARKFDPISLDEFDNVGTALNLKNGWLDLTTETLVSHDRNMMFSKISETEYKSGMLCPKWTKFIKEIFLDDDEVIKFVQKCVGYSLTSNVSEQVIFILKGEGRNGKSVFLKVLSTILGDYAKNIQPEALISNKFNNAGAIQQLATLEKTRFVTTQESEQGTFFNESLVKQLTGDDKLTIKQLYQEPREMPITFKIWMATNHMPFIRGTDNGIWRRLIIIPFDLNLPKEKINKNLDNELLDESSGILNWMIEGYKLWLLEGLDVPERLQMEVDEHRSEMDTFQRFLDDCTEYSEFSSVKAIDLYDIYKEWSVANGEKVLSNKSFGAEIKKKLNKKKTNRGFVYEKVRILERKELLFFNQNIIF